MRAQALGRRHPLAKRAKHGERAKPASRPPLDETPAHRQLSSASTPPNMGRRPPTPPWGLADRRVCSGALRKKLLFWQAAADDCIRTAGAAGNFLAGPPRTRWQRPGRTPCEQRAPGRGFSTPATTGPASTRLRGGNSAGAAACEAGAKPPPRCAAGVWTKRKALSAEGRPRRGMRDRDSFARDRASLTGSGAPGSSDVVRLFPWRSAHLALKDWLDTGRVESSGPFQRLDLSPPDAAVARLLRDGRRPDRSWHPPGRRQSQRTCLAPASI